MFWTILAASLLYAWLPVPFSLSTVPAVSAVTFSSTLGNENPFSHTGDLIKHIDGSTDNCKGCVKHNNDLL